MDDQSVDGPDHPWLRRYVPNINWHAPIPGGTVPDILDRSVALFGDRPCIDFLGRRLTYREVGALVDRMACGFQSLGIGPGQRVGLFLPNCPYFVIAFFAAVKAGAIVVNYNPLYAVREIEHQLQDSGTEILVTLDLAVLYDKVRPMVGTGALKRLVVCRMADALPFPKNLLFPILRRRDLAQVRLDEVCLPYDRLIGGGRSPAPVAVDPTVDIAVLQYTGGTTGTPKGAMLTHANLVANTEQTALWFSVAVPGQERVLGVLPLFHVFAMMVVMTMGLRLGAELILLPKFDIDQVMATIHAKKPTLFPAVPTIYTAINRHKQRERYRLSSIRYCISGGAPLPHEVHSAFVRNTGCRLVEGYGLSESSPVATCNPLDGDNRLGTIGLPLPGTVMEIISLEDGVTPLAAGERGEVCIRGPQVMAGYWNNPEETAATLRHGRLHTGDVGTMDADGYITIVDRIKDLILCSGYNVYPRNVEEAIYQHPAVQECVVAGVPDEYRGQTVKAYVKLVDGAALTEAMLQAFLREHLSPIEIPRIVEFRDQLPRTMIGKLSRKDLLAEEAARRERSSA